MEIPVDYAQANLRFTGTGLPTGAEMTLGLNIELYVDGPDDAALAVKNAWDVAQLETVQAGSCALTEVRVKFGPQNIGPSGAWTGNLVGTSTDAQLSPNSAVLIRKQTSIGGRSGRGRFYMPGYPETVVDAAGTIASGGVTILQNCFNTFRTELINDGLVPVLLHGANSPITTPLPITAFVVDSKIATQRRRLRR